MRALIINEENHAVDIIVREVSPTPVHLDDILIRVEFSGINYKDAMVADSASRVRRVSSLIGGVDAAGVVEASGDSTVPVGSRVAVHGGSIGVARDGGFAEYIYAPSRWISVLPDEISTRSAMVIGTAGFTAMASVLALEDHGLDDGDVLVTGATGGVGSQSVAYLRARGHSPVASTGSPNEHEWLTSLGATRIIGRDEVSDKPDKVLGTELWAGAIDCVGGETLAQVIRCLRYAGAVAASGLVASATLATTVYPFITRGVSLLGIDAVEARAHQRSRVWSALATVVDHVDYEALTDRTVNLEGVVDALVDIRNGATRGRILVDPTAG